MGLPRLIEGRGLGHDACNKGSGSAEGSRKISNCRAQALCRSAVGVNVGFAIQQKFNGVDMRNSAKFLATTHYNLAGTRYNLAGTRYNLATVVDLCLALRIRSEGVVGSPGRFGHAQLPRERTAQGAGWAKSDKVLEKAYRLV